LQNDKAAGRASGLKKNSGGMLAWLCMGQGADLHMAQYGSSNYKASREFRVPLETMTSKYCEKWWSTGKNCSVDQLF